MRRCSRCGDPTELVRLAETRCPRCISEVTALVRSDTERRTRRVFGIAKNLDGWRPA